MAHRAYFTSPGGPADEHFLGAPGSQAQTSRLGACPFPTMNASVPIPRHAALSVPLGEPQEALEAAAPPPAPTS